MNKEFENFKLSNGVEIILIPKKESPATTVMASVKVGSKYETKELSGLSHFLEHMAFKGTKKRPSSFDITSQLEGIGASYNASTGQEFTNYYAKVRNEKFDEALDIISDLYLNSTVPTKELEKERGVILEEINMYEDIPMRKAHDLFEETLYGDQPAGWPILGRKEVIKKITREDFVNYREKHYKSDNTIITISGGFKEKGIKEKLEKYFSDMNKGPETEMSKVEINQKNPNSKIEFKKSDQAHVWLGFHAFPSSDKRSYILEVLSDILGGGMSSRLFTEVREKRGLAYYVGSGAYLNTNSGFIAARAGLNKEKTEEAIKLILKEFKKIKEKKVEIKELERAKEHLIGNLLLSLETSNSLAAFYTEQRIQKLDIVTPQEIVKKIKSVSADEIKQVANDLFKKERLNLAVIGPFKDFGDILKI